MGYAVAAAPRRYYSHRRLLETMRIRVAVSIKRRTTPPTHTSATIVRNIAIAATTDKLSNALPLGTRLLKGT